MLRVILLVALYLLSATTASAGTTRAEALDCFNKALEEAMSEEHPGELITKYLDYASIAANAAQFSTYRSWKDVPKSVRKKMVDAVLKRFGNKSKYDELDLSTVTALRSGKENGESYELHFRYGPPAEAVYYGLLIHFEKRCRVIDVSENGVWLSFAIGQKF